MRVPFLSKPRKRFPTAAEFGFLELHGGETRVVLIPSLGGKITELFMGGREWLWTSDVIPLARGIEGTSYLESGDSGGFDECFPTISSCRVPGWVRSFGGIELPVRPNMGIFTQPISFIGLPVAAVPVWLPGEDLPLGVQVIAAPWREDVCLRIAHQLEMAGVCAAPVAKGFLE